MLRLENVVKSYMRGEVEIPVLKGIDLSIDRGEYVALMGRSGAGKSTLMNILGCLDAPTSGKYEFEGNEIGDLADDDVSIIRGQKIGFVFQSFHLLKRQTILQNVEMPLEYRDTERRERKMKATELLERVGLGHRLEHFPHQLSGGECQRVAIARALVNEPSLVLADEPTGNLDLKAQDKLLALFDELQRELNITLVVVTHDEQIGEAAKRRIVLSEGKIATDEEQGPRDD